MFKNFVSGNAEFLTELVAYILNFNDTGLKSTWLKA